MALRLSIEHLWWTNRRLLDAARRLPGDAWAADQHLTTRSLRATLVHELDAQQAADAATLVSAAGSSPGDIGFLEYIGEGHGRT